MHSWAATTGTTTHASTTRRSCTGSMRQRHNSKIATKECRHGTGCYHTNSQHYRSRRATSLEGTVGAMTKTNDTLVASIDWRLHIPGYVHEYRWVRRNYGDSRWRRDWHYLVVTCSQPYGNQVQRSHPLQRGDHPGDSSSWNTFQSWYPTCRLRRYHDRIAWWNKLHEPRRLVKCNDIQSQ